MASFTRHAAALALVVVTSAQPVMAAEPTLYERVDQALAKRQDLENLGKPAPELDQVRWMLGAWTVEAHVFATPTTAERSDRGKADFSLVNANSWMQMAESYPEGNQDLGFLTYNMVSRRWISVGIDNMGNSVMSTAGAWEGNKLVFTAPGVEILGVRATLRQTMIKLDKDHFSLLNEEQLPGGQWIKLDEYKYQRAGG